MKIGYDAFTKSNIVTNLIFDNEASCNHTFKARNGKWLSRLITCSLPIQEEYRLVMISAWWIHSFVIAVELATIIFWSTITIFNCFGFQKRQVIPFNYIFVYLWYQDFLVVAAVRHPLLYRCEILLSHTSNTDFGFDQF